MAEAQKGFATLEDVDKGTFVRFIEWAHRGYYSAAEFTTAEIESPSISWSQNHDEVVPEVVPAPQEDNGDEVALAPQEEWYLNSPVAEPDVLPTPDPWVYEKDKERKTAIQTGWGMPNDQSRKSKAQKIRGKLKEAFISRRYTVRKSIFEIPPPRPNQKPEEDYTDVFLSHAQLYVFADKYDIQPLKMLALEELHATLAIYTLYLVRTKDIIMLLRYVYGNTGQNDGGEEDLRKLLKTYMGFEMDALMKDEEFRDLMIEDGGPLLGDVMTMVRRRIS